MRALHRSDGKDHSGRCRRRRAFDRRCCCMMTVACVHVVDWPAPGLGPLYVDRLCSMVKRNLRQPHRFVVVGGRPEETWWAKIRLFRPGLFTGRVLYLDLDSVITGLLDELVDIKGIVHL